MNSNILNIPKCGFGTYKLSGEIAYTSTLNALHSGYTHIDTANLYKNEVEIGKAIKDSGILRENIWITTKVQIGDIRRGKDAIYDSVVNSLEKLQTGYLDLVLLHGPTDDVVTSWKALEDIVLGNVEQLKDKVRYIGVSNYEIRHLNILLISCRIKPYTNQIEVSPYMPRIELVEYCRQKDIIVTAHTSLLKGNKFDDSKLENISNRIKINKPLILLAWALWHDMIILPRSSNLEHIQENIKSLNVKLVDDVVKELDEFHKIDTYCTHPQFVDK